MNASSGRWRAGIAAAFFALVLAQPADAQDRRVLDTFESIETWRAAASDGVGSSISQTEGVEGKALRLDFDFRDVAGYAFATRRLPIEFPDNYEISFWMRADSPVNNFEVKLVDATGANVWWRNQRDFVFPSAWTQVRLKKRHIEFAWGPAPERTLRQSERIEFVVTRGSGGGRGSVMIDQIALRELPPEGTAPPAPSASATGTSRGSAPAFALDGNPATAWRAPAGRQSLTIDFRAPREFSGLEPIWANSAHAADYDVFLSENGRDWRLARRVVDGDGGRDPLLLTESEARFVRFDFKRAAARGYELSEIEVEDPAWGATPTAFVETIARAASRGVYPRSFVEQSYWTLIGADGAADNALMSEDGGFEIGKGGFSIEPFVRVDGRLFAWADVSVAHALEDGYLPIPRVTWTAPGWRVEITGFVEGDRAQSALIARYDIANTSPAPQRLDLILAARPFQVNGPRQFLNVQGGVSRIERLAFDEDGLSVNGRLRVVPLTAPTRVAASRFDSGLAPYGETERNTLVDETGFASGAMIYSFALEPGETKTVAFLAPLTGEAALTREKAGDLDMRQRSVSDAWRARLDRVDIRVPEEGQRVVDTLKSSLAHILMSREGPILKPGSRSYDRSWIRDGAMIAEGLIRLGSPEAAADYLRWFAPHQFESGKVPCCVDRRGADPTPENDSHGQFIFLAAEVWRATRDEALLREIWPHVEAAVRHMDALRGSETSKNASADRRHLYGLLPPSISHEGYSSAPAYSYWDDFWALLGYKEAVQLAQAMECAMDRAPPGAYTCAPGGARSRSAPIAASRDAFRRDLYASIGAMGRVHGIDFIPGAADRGDFDATSTTIALTPVGEGAHLPRAALEATFERYWREFVDRREGRKEWDDYTPYEIRNIGAFVRLGWRERAWELLDYFLKDRRPAAWNGWAEVVGQDAREPRFIGDMPHAWISSDYIRSALELFAYWREADEALVLAAGIPAAWLDEGISVRGLRTPFGVLSYTLKRDAERLVLDVAGDAPPGGFVLPWPYESPPGRATLDGRRIQARDGAHLIDGPGRLVIAAR